MSAVITNEEVGRFQDFGLGRGVDATDPNMWDNKSSFVLREISPDMANIIGTEDGGEKQYYSDDVSSHTSLQMKINLSLDEPNSQVKVGMDAHHSRTNSSTRKIVGTKIRTRTIAFRTNFGDLPLQNFNVATMEMPILPFEMEESDSVQAVPLDVRTKSENLRSTITPNSFEQQICAWVLDRTVIRKQQSAEKTARTKTQYIARLAGSNPAAKLTNYLQSLESGSPELQEIMNDCQVFVSELGITHFVSAIELGAMQYQVYMKKDYEKKFGAGTDSGFKQLVKLEESQEYEKTRSRETTSLREIGRIVDGKVQRQSSDEAVIGFHIQPIHRLVKLSYLYKALQTAVKQYIASRSSRTEGPFLISCTMNIEHKPVFWKVSQENQIRGTTQVQDASLFYVIPTEDVDHPFEFFIVYYAEDTTAKVMPKSLYDHLTRSSQQAVPLPQYVTGEGNLFGYSSRPLELNSSVFVRQARFAIYSRIIHAAMMCLSSPVTSASWIEGEEFFVKCSRRRFRADGYLAMKRESPPATRRRLAKAGGREGSCRYKTVILPKVRANPSANIGLLFRLHPAEHKKTIPSKMQQAGFGELEGEIAMAGSTVERHDRKDTSVSGAALPIETTAIIHEELQTTPL